MGASSSKGVKITAHDKAILDLKVQRDKLRLYQRKLEAVLAKETEVAKHHLRNNDKRRALLALKKKKYQEALLQQTDMQLLNLEQMTTIEYSLIERDIIAGLQAGNEVLKQIHKEMSVDAVEKLMDDTAEAIAYQNEIDDIISGKISNDDLEEIEAELDALILEETNSKLAAAPNAPSAIPEGAIDLPDVPPRSPLLTT
ncbi:Snf7 family [Zopfochytrium polystomum]|nr:Snf7 family [Zopfochytrium polystomum]